MKEFEQWIREYGKENYSNEFAFTVDPHKEKQMGDAFNAGFIAAIEKVSEHGNSLWPAIDLAEYVKKESGL